MKTATQTTLLVVDDDDHFRETLSDAMALKDVRVSGARTGEEAVRRLIKSRVSLILLDVQLPDTNGVDMCRRLKSDPRFWDVPVVLLSAKYTAPADRAEGLLIGAKAYLSKPIQLDSLWEEVRGLLGR